MQMPRTSQPAVSGKASYSVINPATGTPFAEAPLWSVDEVALAVDRANHAAHEWGRDPEFRAVMLRNLSDAMEANAPGLAELLTQEQGKPLAASRFEIAATAQWLRAAATQDLADPPMNHRGSLVEINNRPLGVVAAITPWNFPLLIAAFKIAPALRAGNCMVLKPSPFTPLATLRMGEIFNQILPPGVFQVVSGGADIGEMLTSHPKIAKITFTGSTATGTRVAMAAARTLKRVTLELGGNDAAIIMRDADLPAIAKALFWSAFSNCGQVCSGVKRVFVPHERMDELSELLATIAEGVRVGPGDTPGTQMGPIQNSVQLDKVDALVRDAKCKGARIVTGGTRIGDRGYFYEPTIVANAQEGMSLVDDEQFGPALPLIGYEDMDGAIRRANDTTFGLSGSVWGQDRDAARQFANQLDVGTSWVNTHLVHSPDIPFTGAKLSGIGVENGARGLREFTQLHVAHQG